MRVPRVRFRLLTLMIVVTAIVAGLGYTAYLSYLRRRAAEFRALAAYHSQEEVRARAALEPRYHHRYGIDEPSQLRDRAEDCRYWAAAYRRRESYARAALARAESRGLPTTQAERREPWHWEMRVAELEHEARWAEARLRFLYSLPLYHRDTRLAYQRAADRPWESVIVSPPPPEVDRKPPPSQPSPPPD